MGGDDGGPGLRGGDDAIALVVRPSVEQPRQRPPRVGIDGAVVLREAEHPAEGRSEVGRHDEPRMALPGHPPPAVDEDRRQMDALAIGHLGPGSLRRADEPMEPQRHPAHTGDADRPSLRGWHRRRERGEELTETAIEERDLGGEPLAMPHHQIGIGVGLQLQRWQPDAFRRGRVIRIEIRLPERLRRVPGEPEAAGMDPHEAMIGAGHNPASGGEQPAEIRLLRATGRAARHDRGHDRHGHSRAVSLGSKERCAGGLVGDHSHAEPGPGGRGDKRSGEGVEGLPRIEGGTDEAIEDEATAGKGIECGGRHPR